MSYLTQKHLIYGNGFKMDRSELVKEVLTSECPEGITLETVESLDGYPYEVIVSKPDETKPCVSVQEHPGVYVIQLHTNKGPIELVERKPTADTVLNEALKTFRRNHGGLGYKKFLEIRNK